MALSDLMKTFAQRVGIGEVDLDEDGGVQIVLGETLAVDVVADEQGRGFSMVASVARLPGERREAAFTEMLEANALGLGSGGVCLGIDPHRQEVVLRCHYPSTELPIEVLDQELAAFAGELAFWRERCECGQLGTPNEKRSGVADAESPASNTGIRV